MDEKGCGISDLLYVFAIFCGIFFCVSLWAALYVYFYLPGG